MPKAPSPRARELIPFVELAGHLGSKYGWDILEAASRSPVLSTQLSGQFAANRQWIRTPMAAFVDHRLGEVQFVNRTAKPFALIERGRTVVTATRGFLERGKRRLGGLRMTPLLTEILDVFIVEHAHATLTPMDVHAAIHQRAGSLLQRGDGYSREWLTGRLNALAERGLLERLPSTVVSGREDRYRLPTSLRAALAEASRMFSDTDPTDIEIQKTPLTRLLPWLISSVREDTQLPRLPEALTTTIAHFLDVVAPPPDVATLFTAMAHAADILLRLYSSEGEILPKAELAGVAVGKNIYQTLERLDALGVVDGHLLGKVKYWSLSPAVRPLLQVIGIDSREVPVSWLPRIHQGGPGYHRRRSAARMLLAVLRNGDWAPLSHVGEFAGFSPQAMREVIRPFAEAGLARVHDGSGVLLESPCPPPPGVMPSGVTLTLDREVADAWRTGIRERKSIQDRVATLIHDREDAGRWLLGELAARDRGKWNGRADFALTLQRFPRDDLATLEELASLRLLERREGPEGEPAWRLPLRLWDGLDRAVADLLHALKEGWSSQDLTRLALTRTFTSSPGPLSEGAQRELEACIVECISDVKDPRAQGHLSGTFMAAADINDPLAQRRFSDAFMAVSDPIAAPVLQYLGSSGWRAGASRAHLQFALGVDQEALYLFTVRLTPSDQVRSGRQMGTGERMSSIKEGSGSSMR